MRISPLSSLVVALALGACGSYSPPPPPTIAPLTAYPTRPVASSALPPPVMTQPMTPAPVGEMPAQTAEAAPPALAPAAASTAEVRKTDLIGGWKLASAGESCQLSMNLTTWTGGYRASTRGCASDELKSIGAWDLEGNQVLLKDASGSVVARLSATGPSRFSGQTDVSRRGIQFFRG